jgi:hypothetical protein
MHWLMSNRADRRARPLADRHYSRQKPGASQFVAAGSCVVLLTEDADALWVSLWQLEEYVKHAWPGAWVCSFFRNESPILSSKLIREAVAVTRSVWGDPPELGMVTFVDTVKTRRKRDPGRCFRRAGFAPCGWTKGGLFALQLLPGDMPEAEPAFERQLSLF